MRNLRTLQPNIFCSIDHLPLELSYIQIGSLYPAYLQVLYSIYLNIYASLVARSGNRLFYWWSKYSGINKHVPLLTRSL